MYYRIAFGLKHKAVLVSRELRGKPCRADILPSNLNSIADDVIYKCLINGAWSMASCASETFIYTDTQSYMNGYLSTSADS